jgi:hypothetical protein
MDCLPSSEKTKDVSLELGTADNCCYLAPLRFKSSTASILASSQSSLLSLQNPQSSFSLPLDGLACSALTASQPFSDSPSSTGFSSTADTPYDFSTVATSTDPSPARPSTDLSSSSRSSDRRAESLEAFFAAELETEINNEKQRKQRKKRVQQLARAVQGFTEYKEPPDTFYRDFWSVTSQIFNGHEAGSAPKGDLKAEVAYRLGRLGKARNRIPSKDEITRRLCLVFLAHDVEYISRQEGMETSKGVGKKSTAMQIAAEALSEAPEEVQSVLKGVRSDCKGCRNYMDLVEEGPSLLLEVGDHVRSM